MIATLESVASCADSSSELRPPFQQAVACRVFPKETLSLYPEAIYRARGRRFGNSNRQVTERGDGNLAQCISWLRFAVAGAEACRAADQFNRWTHAIPELAVMANVLNPETESITLNTELETPTLEPATELETLRVLTSRRTSPRPTPKQPKLSKLPELDADTQLTKSDEPVAEEAPESAPEAEAAASPVCTRRGSGRADGRFLRRPRGL